MNIWGGLFFLPLAVLLGLDPVKAAATMALALALLSAALWLLNAVIGPKPRKHPP